jgi:YesN/AraC family two-component response regulator
MAGAVARRPVILTVDDDDGVRETLRVVLEPEFEVLEADSGAAGLKRLAECPVDLVLLDVRMSGMDGIEVLRRLRETGNKVGVILITAVADVRTVVDAMKLGAFDYVTKPFDIDELMAHVHAALADEAGGEPVVALIGGPAGVRAAVAVLLGARVRVISAATAADARAQAGRAHAVMVDLAGTRDAAALRERLPAILDEIARAVPGWQAPAFRPYVLRVVEYASANYRIGSLAALGTLVGASPRHLLRVFREDVGMGLKEYMNRVRVEVAKPLLAAGEKLEAVAQQLGVPSGAHFSRLFRRHTGGRPGSYRAPRGADD